MKPKPTVIEKDMKKKNKYAKIKEAIVWSANWEMNEKYFAILPIKRLHALKYVFTGKARLEWFVPISKRDKSLKISGNKL